MSNNDVLIELYDENNNLQDSIIKKFVTEESAKLFIQMFYEQNFDKNLYGNKF